jgi:histidinol-phosphate/aromatic aminotransferase/cobyric acid decarboxylase-like protein
MRFPLADWIDAHPECRFDLASSGMRGSVPAPPWPARRPGREVVAELRQALAHHLGVAPERLFLSHGASEGNGWVLGFLGRDAARQGRVPVLRVRYPEYPPLFEGARALGFAVRTEGAPADLAIVSRPRNPEGGLWAPEELANFSDGARQLLVDETFREFAEVRSVAVDGAPRLWTTGTFTKFYGGDDVRVGFVVAPPEAVGRFGRYVGLVSDELAPGSAAAALELLHGVRRVRAAVRSVFGRNLRAFAAAFPYAPLPAAPLFFDRLGERDGTLLARRCLQASVLVSPGAFFGRRHGVRVCLTRRNFPQGLEAYLRVRDRPGRRG